MITKFEINKYLGLDGWVSFYIWLQNNKNAGSEIVRIAVTGDGTAMLCQIKVPLYLAPNDLVWTVSISQVKANAFDEIFNRLPTAETVSVIQELVGEIAQRAEVTGEHIHTFLNNLPTRTECK